MLHRKCVQLNPRCTSAMDEEGALHDSAFESQLGSRLFNPEISVMTQEVPCPLSNQGDTH